MKTIGEITIQSDENGMITLQCDRCKTRFKVEVEYLNEELEGDIYCPACGMPSELSDFFPEEIREQALAAAENEALKMIQEAFSGLNSKNFKVTNTKIPRVDTKKVFSDKDFDMQVTEMQCCKKKIGLRNMDAIAGYYCPYCGRIEK